MGLAGSQHEERLEGDFLEAVPLLFSPMNLRGWIKSDGGSACRGA